MLALVKRYKLNTHKINNEMRKQLIVDYSPLIRFIAQRIVVKLPANIEIDDLISSGIIGLMDAIDKYDPTRDNKFRTYAEFRIRGAILDELRSQDWVPRSVRDKAKKVEKSYMKLEQHLGRSVSEGEVSKEMDMSLEQYHRMITKVRMVMLVSVDEVPTSGTSGDDSRFSNDKGSSDPFINLKNKYLKQTLVENIESLPERQKLVLSLYYYEQLNLKEIGRILNVTESRVSQIHTQAISKLRSKLGSSFLE
ncbi:MAG: FliA/WhiG family RNA polymerase sigma factor [Pseudomonadota bacterium]|nr:FliA/WhiG family RNA polymerase sigma factor [Pseudomonadota bacterium]